LWGLTAADERIGQLESENEALRTHLRLALSTIRDPIPETLYLDPDPEEAALTGDFATSSDEVFDEFDEWADAFSVLAFEANWLHGEVARWKGDVCGDLERWGITIAA